MPFNNMTQLFTKRCLLWIKLSLASLLMTRQRMEVRDGSKDDSTEGGGGDSTGGVIYPPHNYIRETLNGSLILNVWLSKFAPWFGWLGVGRGWGVWGSVTSGDKICIVTPPDIPAVQFKEGHTCIQPVPGMVEMQEGVPYVALVNGNNAKAVMYPEGKPIWAFVKKLQNQIWGRAAIPLSISKEEWEVFKHIMMENNVFSFGRLELGAVGCQMNISECLSGEELVKAIGDLHAKDNPLTFTLVTILLHIPPGIYTDIDNYDRISVTNEVITNWNLSGLVNNVVYISYIQKGSLRCTIQGVSTDVYLTSSCRGTIQQAFAPGSLYFGNQTRMETTKARDYSYLNYLQHGRLTLRPSFENYVALELACMVWNGKVKVRMDLGYLLATVQDPNRTRQICPPIYPIAQAKQLWYNHIRYLHMQSVVFGYSINLVKEDLQCFCNSSQAVNEKRKREVEAYKYDEGEELEVEAEAEADNDQNWRDEDNNCEDQRPVKQLTNEP
ncbi:uncharacterized protein EDB91DRAFT_1081625 [Suillus paluster]|uniref:uncharacterized protein n=1 Tax=Suillus paluster TaxID=48578 RepID=UPI001B86D793|nr:uncharacterized protein EDB91DRAFT_1081625 [Suillus paluster]KAG1741829.1 hypothetical protein EDB91DRAFT_1081625 [Suillus paluster]